MRSLAREHKVDLCIASRRWPATYCNCQPSVPLAHLWSHPIGCMQLFQHSEPWESLGTNFTHCLVFCQSRPFALLSDMSLWLTVTLLPIITKCMSFSLEVCFFTVVRLFTVHALFCMFWLLCNNNNNNNNNQFM